MLEAISLDANTVIIKADKESDISEIIDFISKKDKQNNINSFLSFAAQHRVIDKAYKFDRNECYER